MKELRVRLRPYTPGHRAETYKALLISYYALRFREHKNTFFCNLKKNILNMILPEVQDALENMLRQSFGSGAGILNMEKRGGGSINEALVLRTTVGSFFAKWNNLSDKRGLFRAEKKGLELLASCQCIRVPKAYAAYEEGPHGYLLMELLETGDPEFGFWEDFGQQIAALHRHTSDSFGLDEDNYCGSLRQVNTPQSRWSTFFIENRLQPMLKLAVDNNKADAGVVKKMESLYTKLDEIFPEEKPALLHGDLWGGNFMCTLSGEAAIYDPAVYYGHREMDLGMSRLFGGFDLEFYEAYDEAYPLQPGWQKRLDICNIYPLLVHVNLFPGSYIQSVKNILSRF